MIKVWIGTFHGNEENYLSYFDEDDCKFCDDIEEEYDPDFIGIIPLFSEIVSIEELARQTPLGASSRDLLINDCLSLNINEGNAVLFYSGDTREIEQGEIFNQLKYIGEYMP
ncbi:MAG TPA: immunity 22 family protein [Flavobacterium sp.]|nr:immunity 22 family protein [Flavobacterium sp.]